MAELQEIVRPNQGLSVAFLRKIGSAIRRGDNHFRELLEALPAAIYTTDAAGRITYYNEAAAVLWGSARGGQGGMVRVVEAVLAGRQTYAARRMPDGFGAQGESAHPRP